MFKEALQAVVDNTEGGVAGLLMGYDGIPVEQYVREGQAIDVEVIGMEFSVVLKGILEAAERLDAGTAREVAIKAERLTTVIRFINSEYFVAVTLKPSGNIGKARFLLRTQGQKLADELTF